MTTDQFTFEMVWSEYEAIIQGISYEYGCKYRTMGASTEDFRQELLAWLLDNEAKIARKYEGLGDHEAFGRWLARCLRNEANDYAVDIRDQAGFQPRQGAHWYSTADLRTLLPSVFDRQAWTNPPKSDDENGRSRAVKALSEGNNWVTTLADVSAAFERLEPKEQGLLRRFHQWDEKNIDLAEEFGLTQQQMSAKHTRILEKMVEFLGGPRPQPMRADDPNDVWRGRHSIPAQKMRAITSSYYEED